MRLNDTQAHFSYLRMSRERLEHLTIVGPLLVRRENYWSAIRANITPAERLALTIRYLAIGNRQISFFNFHLGKFTVSVCRMLRETCELLYVFSIFISFFSQQPKAWIASYCLHQLLLSHPKRRSRCFVDRGSHEQNEFNTTHLVLFFCSLIGRTQRKVRKDRILVYPCVALRSLRCVACGLR